MGTINLNSDITYLHGVGEKKAQILHDEFNIFTMDDLLNYYPYRYVDKSKFYNIREVPANINTYLQVKGVITDKQIIGEGRARRLVAKLQDHTGVLTLTWFNNIKYFNELIQPQTIYIVFGKPTVFNSSINITHPEISTEEANTAGQIPFQPMYNSGDKAKRAGLDSRGISKLCYTLLSQCMEQIQETLPLYIRQKLQLIDRATALKNIHFPTSAKDIEQATRRLKFEEVFFMQLIMQRMQQQSQRSNGFLMPKVGNGFNTFYHHHLQFDLTNAQKKVIKEIRADFLSGKQMNRLLQGDVGSGKTITALLVMLLAIDNGYQCCLMAPTEILAQQHYVNICKMLGNMNVEVKLLTGSTKPSERKKLLEHTQNGTTNILIGTHALCEDNVLFKRLGMVVIDEQHRFGVEQRAKLWRKSLVPPHVLVMTATPIPRTLAMTLYGDLDVSVIDELPKGRKPIQTMHFYRSQGYAINHFLRKQIANGRQIYVVFPLIQESEKLTLSNLMDGYERFKKSYPEPQYHVSCLHGKMSGEEKDAEMQKFKQGETDILLATTVIEVGIDVPNATIMIIENAERFGLSQLHQLRGRVGRGNEQSYCLLLTDEALSQEAKIRIKAMVDTCNGFEIANVDLKLRGPGEIAGTRQSGMINFKLLNITADEPIISTARNISHEVIANDPTLSKPENAPLHIGIAIANRNSNNYFQIG